MVFEKKPNLSNVNHERMYKLITNVILNDLKHITTLNEISQKLCLKTLCYNSKGTRKVKDFQKLSNK